MATRTKKRSLPSPPLTKIRASECSVIKINAGNDSDGNPRRGWIILHPKHLMIGFVEEGYSGRGAFDEIFVSRDANVLKNAAANMVLNVPPSEYRALTKWQL